MTKAAGSRGRQVLGRVLIIGVILALPVQLTLDALINEPYPALILPSFADVRRMTDGELTVSPKPVSTVGFADGSSEPVKVDQLLPPSAVPSSWVFGRLFRTKANAKHPRLAGWLENRLETLFPGRDVTSFTVSWVERTFDADLTLLSTDEERRIRVNLPAG
jgi:hypothetical protein